MMRREPIATRLRRRREMLGMSAREVGYYTGIPEKSILRYETGEFFPSSIVAKKLTKFYKQRERVNYG